MVSMKGCEKGRDCDWGKRKKEGLSSNELITYLPS